jgi:hypothetical protein
MCNQHTITFSSRSPPNECSRRPRRSLSTIERVLFRERKLVLTRAPFLSSEGACPILPVPFRSTASQILTLRFGKATKAHTQFALKAVRSRVVFCKSGFQLLVLLSLRKPSSPPRVGQSQEGIEYSRVSCVETMGLFDPFISECLPAPLPLLPL